MSSIRSSECAFVGTFFFENFFTGLLEMDFFFGALLLPTDLI
ncbi:hypothetical protein LEP1GSC005_1366 [Leptospira santarosai str. ST188]|uniref:Uncharacterized protein n=1 Tax=Leptospira santarosai str. ZUN179 TaxID=1049985 RepID=M6VC58_9LEPT|nr:hypothetical protein LEP1GSC005_1366 [Leptospira santarosai str. ST188]EMO14687.1 hypothetical protein LEP1GSC165_0413 [Leptospira santarosai str. CBC523]EMO21789.1 hypothetical protein LEP1GSC168_4233 [Leptospira santarosai str. HAI134]EMO47103.1 hypothetical protein LEP1GSC187_1020 [Leptospira santarosai str. ZUN179]